MREWERWERAELHDPDAVRRSRVSTAVMALVLGVVVAGTIGLLMFWHWWAWSY